MRHLWLALATLVAALFAVTQAFALAPPKLEGRVNDYAELLSADDEARISRALEAHEKATGQQFAVLTIPSLEGDSLEEFSIHTVEAWKLGREKQDDGLLLLVVKDDHKIRIEVGHGLEGSITDAVSSRIIRGILTPAFRNGDYPGGIERALRALMELETKGSVMLPAEPAEPPPPRPEPQVPGLLRVLFFLLIGIIPFWIVRRGGGGGGRGGFGGGYPIWFGGFGGGGGDSGGGFSSGGFSGGGGGGGFSGGGGSFGGGGASGSW